MISFYKISDWLRVFYFSLKIIQFIYTVTETDFLNNFVLVEMDLLLEAPADLNPNKAGLLEGTFS